MFRKTTPLALILAATATAACSVEAESSENRFAEVQVYQDGIGALSDGSTFKVVLFSEAGALEPGVNDLYVRVGRAVPGNPLNEGDAVVNAKLTVDAFGEAADVSIAADRIAHMGDGTYLLQGVEFDAGVLELDIDVDVDGNQESVTFAFTIE
jgi:hypothetical protein